MDLLKTHEGIPFIPGTSIAGVLRNYLGGGCYECKEEGLSLPVTLLFGKRDKESTQSLLFVSDGRLKQDSQPEIKRRDGIELDFDTQTTIKGAKYDYEIIEPGAVFEIRFEFICREMHKDELINLKHCLYLITNALENEKICIGAKTRRGLGKGKLENIQILDLDFNDSKTQNDMVKKWVEFDWDSIEPNRRADDWKHGIDLSVPYTDLKVEFKIPYSFLIRDYIAALSDADLPDAVQLQCAGKPVVPGSSWAGALRHHMKRICFNLLNNTGNFSDACSLKEKIDKEIINELFGYVCKKDKTAQASRISFEESEIRNSTHFSYTRNKIDRFTGGTVDTALFTEKPVWGKPVRERNDTSVSLNIRIEKPLPKIDDYETGLLLLGINDLWHGIQPVGGGVSVGRGILAGQDISINSSEKKDIDSIDNSKYMAALYKKMQEFIAGDKTASSRGDADG
jgi:CRISPR/Cas system CSM-associated protein Csm3 (group 7 of RAMP superfamily)